MVDNFQLVYNKYSLTEIEVDASDLHLSLAYPASLPHYFEANTSYRF